jgi:hypothetical protein
LAIDGADKNLTTAGQRTRPGEQPSTLLLTAPKKIYRLNTLQKLQITGYLMESILSFTDSAQ